MFEILYTIYNIAKVFQSLVYFQDDTSPHRIHWPLSRLYEMMQFLWNSCLTRKISLQAGDRIASVKTSCDMRDVRKCFRNKVHFVSALSSGPHVTDLGKGPLRELNVARARGSLSKTIHEKCRSHSECRTGFGDRRELERATLLRRSSLDGDPEQARCFTMRSSVCLANECISVQLNYARF